MSHTRLNLIAAAVALTGSFILLTLGFGFEALVWAVASLVWLGYAIWRVRDNTREERPADRLLRRFSRLVMWG
jgi:hypothetical protein